MIFIFRGNVIDIKRFYFCFPNFITENFVTVHIRWIVSLSPLETQHIKCSSINLEANFRFILVETAVNTKCQIPLCGWNVLVVITANKNIQKKWNLNISGKWVGTVNDEMNFYGLRGNETITLLRYLHKWTFCSIFCHAVRKSNLYSYHKWTSLVWPKWFYGGEKKEDERGGRGVVNLHSRSSL